MWMGLTLGATAGFMLAYQQSAGELLGILGCIAGQWMQ